ncbi:MAG TPA: DinB family protein [Chitinophagaceae bacterium]|nr:DinB family protein [Chitinophagaceae bacterium]
MALHEALLAEFKHEAGLTRKMLERVPMESVSWKPHEKSMTLGRLATHIAEIPHWVVEILSTPEFDFAARPYNPRVAGSLAELLDIHDQNAARAVSALAAAGDTILNDNWTVRRGETVVFAAPRKVALRGWAYNHLYHHRGQLSVYLRMLEVAVPGMYGPSADER